MDLTCSLVSVSVEQSSRISGMANQNMWIPATTIVHITFCKTIYKFMSSSKYCSCFGFQSIAKHPSIAEGLTSKSSTVVAFFLLLAITIRYSQIVWRQHWGLGYSRDDDGTLCQSACGYVERMANNFERMFGLRDHLGSLNNFETK